MTTSKQRLDQLLVSQRHVPTRSKAKALIMAGQVRVNGQRIDKAGTMIPANATVEVLQQSRFVSRGGDKLQAALDAFQYGCQDLVAIDIGASTGGFTDALLQAGAQRVYAVDVGYGQLDWRLRQDSRVIVLERENIRYLEQEKIPERCQLAVIDCSFISLRLVLPHARRFLSAQADLIVLIKPQFEAGKSRVGKGGVIRDQALRRTIIQETIDEAKDLGFSFHQGIDCPVHGPSGNIEYLAWFKMNPQNPDPKDMT